MKISEFEEILKAAREAHGDREVSVTYRSGKGIELVRPELMKWHLKPESEENFTFVIG